MTDDSSTLPRLRLRGRSFIAVALVPEPPVMEWLARLDAELERAPSFFARRPVVLDLSVANFTNPASAPCSPNSVHATSACSG